MEKIGIYGGTFNPPHMGHVHVARYAIGTLCLDKLLIIPSNTPPHKELSADSPTPNQRLAMLQMVFAGEEKTEVNDLELQRGGVSYTFDTVNALQAQYPNAQFYLLVGTDMLLSFDRWYRYEELLQKVTLAVFYRGDKEEKTRILKKKEELEAQGAQVVLMENPVIPISSTQLRRMMIFGCAGEYPPEHIHAYICENGLYSTHRDFRNLPMEELEQVVVSLLKPNRVAHVLGCRDTAKELAKIWGADETDAARAGLLHDITKALSGPLQLAVCRTYGVELSEFSSQNPKTLHALTGSLVAEWIFGENPGVVAAICSHTTGKADMNTLEKIIYVADYMEPNRDFPGVEELRHLAYTDLDGALKMGLEMTLSMLKEQGREISPESQEALSWLNQKYVPKKG